LEYFSLSRLKGGVWVLKPPGVKSNLKVDSWAFGDLSTGV